MNVIVIGATGRVGQETVEALVERGHSVTAAGRNIEKIAKTEQVTPVHFDLEEDIDDLANIIKGHDAIIFTAGSRNEDLLRVDAFGVVRVAEAARRVDVRRFILLGAKWAAYPEVWNRPEIKPAIDSLREYYIAKYFADNYVMSSEDLDFTIIEPDELLETAGTGNIEINNMEPVGTPIRDVAEVLAACVEIKRTIGKVYTINSGTHSIDDTLNNKNML